MPSNRVDGQGRQGNGSTEYAESANIVNLGVHESTKQANGGVLSARIRTKRIGLVGSLIPHVRAERDKKNVHVGPYHIIATSLPQKWRVSKRSERLDPRAKSLVSPNPQ